MIRFTMIAAAMVAMATPVAASGAQEIAIAHFNQDRDTVIERVKRPAPGVLNVTFSNRGPDVRSDVIEAFNGDADSFADRNNPRTATIYRGSTRRAADIFAQIEAETDGN